MFTVAPLPERARALPLPSDAAAPVIETSVEVSEVPAAILKVIDAITPFPIDVVLSPETIHRTSLDEMALQSTAFPAPLPAEPVVS